MFTKQKLKVVLKVLLKVMTHRVTYRFLAVLLGAIGVLHSDELVSKLETLVCGLFTQCY